MQPNSSWAAKLCGLVSLTLLLGLATPASTRAASTIPTTTITHVAIYAGSSGATGAYVIFSPANEVWIDFSSTTEPTGKSLYATLLAAWLAGRSIIFEVNGCAASGQVPLVYQVDVSG